MIVPTVLAGWVDNRIRPELERIAKVRDVVKLIDWMRERVRVGETNGTNGVRAAILISIIVLGRDGKKKREERGSSWAM